MSLIHQLITVLTQLRSRRGFGIHSPYAFRFIRDVINEDHRYGYTAYTAIASICCRAKESGRDAEMRRFYRILAFGDVAEIHPGSDPLYRALASLYRPSGTSQQKSAPERNEAWVISSCSDPLPSIEQSCLRRGVTFVIWPGLRDERVRCRFRETESERINGLTFTDGHSAITVLTSILPRQTFNVKI